MYCLMLVTLHCAAVLAVRSIDTPPRPLVTGTPRANSSHRSTLWQPHLREKWDYLILAPLFPNATSQATDVKVFDIDLFDNSVSTFKALQNKGKHVICYFSAGSYEAWRNDCIKFGPHDLGNPVKDDLREDGAWPGEWWVDVRSPGVRKIMKERLETAKAKGCNAVEPDNMGKLSIQGIDLVANGPYRRI
jgi:hypothetical protein